MKTEIRTFWKADGREQLDVGNVSRHPLIAQLLQGLKLSQLPQLICSLAALLLLVTQVYGQGSGGPYNYLYAYDGTLHGTWIGGWWGPGDYDPATDPNHSVNYSASAPGRTNLSIELKLGQPNGPWAFGLADRKPGWDNQWKYLNEFHTIEFDVYFEPDSAPAEGVVFILDDGGASDQPNLVSFIPNWASLSPSEQYGSWHHVVVDVASIHPKHPYFAEFLLWSAQAGVTHLRIADVKLGWSNDITNPKFTSVSAAMDGSNSNLVVQFTTDEYTIYRVEYGVSNYTYSVQGDYLDWNTNHTAVLDKLVPGVSNQFRILVLDHHFDAQVDSNLGTYEGGFLVPNSATVAPLPGPNATPSNYTIAYDGIFHGDWLGYWWAPDNYDPATDPGHAIDFEASIAGNTGPVIEVALNQPNGPWAFGLTERKPGWVLQPKFFNESQNIEFDVKFETNSVSVDEITFFLDDVGYSDAPRLVDLIPGWFVMSHDQRYGHWHHVAVDLASLHPTRAFFVGFIVYSAESDPVRYQLANVRFGWTPRTTPPVINFHTATLSPAYDQLELSFGTDEVTIYEVDYGVNDYGQQVKSTADDWNLEHKPILTGLAPGTVCQYKIYAMDHRADPQAGPNVSIYSGTFTIPAKPTTPPGMIGLTAQDITSARASVVWQTDRACTATVQYQKTGGSEQIRSFPGLATNHTCILDLLEPLTEYTANVTSIDAFSLTNMQSIHFTTTGAGAPSVTITIDPSGEKPISPWIYGVNFYEKMADAPRNLTLNRAGGNRWTAYNWENNASNAGIDYGPYHSDDYLGGGELPGEAVRSLVAADRVRGNASLITVPLQGYVAADKNGNVNKSDPSHLANRFKKLVYSKGAAFTATPPTSDDFVYADEFLWALRGMFPSNIYSDVSIPTFVSLDNEPDLWSSTHPEIQPTMPTADDFIRISVALSKALKAVDQNVTLFGPVNYGFTGLVNWQVSPGFTSDYWFVDKYLQDMKAASDLAGQRLLDVYDLHWYSEATDHGTRIGSLGGTNLTSSQVEAIVQSPRSLWDATYVEDSWITGFLGGPIKLLDRMQAKIDANWPGTKLAITEYENGGDNHIAGAIAEADDLGIFGSRGVFAATFWPTADHYPFIMAALKMYRDFDDNLGSFGDISIADVSSDTSKVAAYVSRDSKQPGRYVIVAINRSTNSQDTAFTGLPVSGTAKLYRLQGTQPTPFYAGSVTANLSSWIVTLPPLSVSTVEIISPVGGANYEAWKEANFTAQEQQDTGVSGPNATTDGSGIRNIIRYAFDLPAHGPVSHIITPVIVSTAGADYLAASFTRRTVATDLSYRIESSSDLSHWVTVTDLGPGEPASVTVSDSIPVSTAQARYLRVSVIASGTIFGLTPTATYRYMAIATNSAGLTSGANPSFTTATNLSAPTAITLSESVVNENQPSGTSVGTLADTDSDAEDTAAFALVSGNGSTDNAFFQIVGNLLQTAASFDYETKNSYSVRIRVTDSGGLSYEQSFTIGISNLNEPPAFSGYSLAAAKNSMASILVAKLLTRTSDPEDDACTISSVGSASNRGGTVTFSGAVVEYTPPTDYTGPDSFSIVFSDGSLTTTGFVTVSVGGAVGSGPTLISITSTGNGVQLKFSGIPGNQYYVQRSTSLTQPVMWSTLSTVTANSNGFILYTDSNPPSPSYWRTLNAS